MHMLITIMIFAPFTFCCCYTFAVFQGECDSSKQKRRWVDGIDFFDSGLDEDA